MTNRTVFAAALAIGCGLPLMVHAQRGQQPATGEKPKVDIVQSVGCVERESGDPETWWLKRAAEPKVTQAGMSSTRQIEEAKSVALGTHVFQLIGVADFLDTEGLLRSGQRTQFTTPETANATGQLREGHKVLVKGLLIEAADQKRINLMAVIALTDTCG